MTSTNSLCAKAALIARLASNNQACSSSPFSLAPTASCVAQQVRELAGFSKAGGVKAGAAKKKYTGVRDGPDEDNPRFKPIITLLSSPALKEIPLTPKEQESVAAYNHMRMAEHHAWVKDMSVKFKLQQAALKALPERLRLLAMQPDHTPFPMNRKFLFDTPPEPYRDPVIRGDTGVKVTKAGGK